MRTHPKVLACVDRSPYADHVADYAAWVAGRLHAPLELLHVIDHSEFGEQPSDLSGTIGMDTKEHLLSDLSGADERRSREQREAGRIFLDRLRRRAMGAGVPDPDVRQRHGQLLETLAEQQGSVELFVLGRRGESAATTHRDLGRNFERVVRGLKRPILAVTDGFSAPTRVLVAYDGGAVIRRGIEMLSASPLLRGLPVLVLMAGKARSEWERQLAWATRTLADAGFDVDGAVVPGDPERVIAEVARDRAIDLMVMGAFGHSPLRSLLLGSRTSGLLRSASVPTLLVR